MRESKAVAIHQPNFFPWLGYFNKIAYADAFVILDNVQFPKTGGTWSNRVQLIVNGKPSWITMPVVRAYEGVRLIREMEIGDAGWRFKFLQTLQHSYKRAPSFDKVYPVLAELINNPAARVGEYNMLVIRTLSRALGFDTSKIVLGSTLDVEGKATDLLIAIVKAIGGTTYLCGGGATGYQEDDKFAARGLGVIYQDFQHPVYQQRDGKTFIPGLSIIDALMNCGFDETRRLLMRSMPQYVGATITRPSFTIP